MKSLFLLFALLIGFGLQAQIEIPRTTNTGGLLKAEPEKTSNFPLLRAEPNDSDSKYLRNDEPKKIDFRETNHDMMTAGDVLVKKWK